MKYNEKIENAEYLLQQFLEGRKEESVLAELKEKGLSNSNIDAISFSAKKMFHEKYEARILADINEDGEFVLIDELEQTDWEWCKKYYDFTRKKLKEIERKLIEKLVDGSSSRKEIIEDPRFILHSASEIDSVFNRRLEKQKKRKREAYMFLIAGFIFLAIFLYSLMNGGFRFLSAIVAVIMFYRSYEKLK